MKCSTDGSEILIFPEMCCFLTLLFSNIFQSLNFFHFFLPFFKEKTSSEIFRRFVVCTQHKRIILKF